MPEDEEAAPEAGSALRTQLEAIQAENARIAAENAALQRQVAFAEAKLPDSPQVKFFSEHYSGPMTPEAIKAAATEAGFISDGPTEAQQAQVALITETVAGASTPPGPNADAAILEEFARVRPGQNAVQEIETIMRRHNRPTAQDYQ